MSVSSGPWQRVKSAFRRAAGVIGRGGAGPSTPDQAPTARLIGATAVILVLMLSGLLAAMLIKSHGEAIADAEHRIQDFTDVLAEHATLVFDDIDRTLQAANKTRERLMRSGQWGPGAGDRPFEALLELRPSSAAATNLSWIDEKGDRLHTALARRPPPLSIAERPYFRAHRDDPTLDIDVGSPNLSALTGKYLIPVSRRFDLPDGSFGGITVVLIDPSYLSKFYQSVTRRQRLYIQLTLRNGTVVMREPSAGNLTGVSIAGGALFTKHLPQAPTGTYSTVSAVDGVERIVGYKAIPKLPLVITVSINRSDALVDWYRDGILMVAVYAVLVVMVGGGAWLSIHQLRQRARRQREQAEAKETLRQAEKQQALGTLVGGIAHEINNALLPIMTMGEMVEESLPEAGFERDGVAQMLQSARQIEGLIKRVLDLSREDAPTQTTLDVAGFLARIAATSRAGLPKSIALTEQVANGLGTVSVSEEKLSQVFTDLISNAATAIGAKPGHIEVSATPAFDPAVSPAAGTGQGEFVRLSVKDDGPGIPPVVRPRLFEPFFTTKEAGSGVGLGLYTARRVITELGGYLDVESEPGKGACFFVILPRSPAPASEAMPAGKG